MLWEICPAVGSTTVRYVRYRLPSFCWSVNVYKSDPRDMKNCFRGSCVNKMLGNIDIAYMYIYIKGDWKHGLKFVCLYFLNYIRYMNEREDPVFQISPLERSPSAEPCSSVSWEQNGSMLHKICVPDLIKTQSATAVQRAFCLRFNIQPPTRKGFCRWNHQFEQIWLSVYRQSSGRPRVSEENLSWIQESFESSLGKSTGRASRELGISQQNVWRVLRRRSLFKWVHLFESQIVCVCVCAKFFHIHT